MKPSTQLLLCLILAIMLPFFLMEKKKPETVIVTTTTVHAVISAKPDKCIEKVFRTKEGALKYIDAYRANHDYYHEEILLEE